MPQAFAAAETGRATPSTQAAARPTRKALFIRPCCVVADLSALQDGDQAALVHQAVAVPAAHRADHELLVGPGEREEVVADLGTAPIVADLVPVAEELVELPAGEELEADVVGDAPPELRLGPEQPVGVAVVTEDERGRIPLRERGDPLRRRVGPQ